MKIYTKVMSMVMLTLMIFSTNSIMASEIDTVESSKSSESEEENENS